MRQLGERFFTESGIKSESYNFSMGSSGIINESKAINAQSENIHYDIFLSHSSQDKNLIIKFYQKLKSMYYTVYIDWINDSESGRKEITPKLKTAMNNSFSMLYVHTHNSENSKWTPWEIGYFDSKKVLQKLVSCQFSMKEII